MNNEWLLRTTVSVYGYAIRPVYGPLAGSKPRFFDKPVFLELLYLNGEENVELAEFSEAGRAEIVKRLSEKEIAIGVLFTNASLLTEDVLDMLEEYHQKPSFQLSFDGLGHHDWLRGVPGAEQQADQAFRLLQQRGMHVSAAMCIHKENKDSLRNTVRYLAERGVQELRVNSPESLGEWKDYEDRYAMSQEEVWEVFCAAIWDYFRTGCPSPWSWTAFSGAARAAIRRISMSW